MPALRLASKAAAVLDAKLSTRIADDVDRRLRLFVTLRAGGIGQTVNEVLDHALPSLQELADELARGANPTKDAAPGRSLTTSKDVMH